MKTRPDPTLHIWTTKYCILSTTTIAGDCRGCCQASCRKFRNIWCVLEYFDPFGWRQSPHTALVCTIKKKKKKKQQQPICGSWCVIPFQDILLAFHPPQSECQTWNVGSKPMFRCQRSRFHKREFWNSQSTVNNTRVPEVLESFGFRRSR